MQCWRPTSSLAAWAMEIWHVLPPFLTAELVTVRAALDSVLTLVDWRIPASVRNARAAQLSAQKGARHSHPICTSLVCDAYRTCMALCAPFTRCHGSTSTTLGGLNQGAASTTPLPSNGRGLESPRRQSCQSSCIGALSTHISMPCQEASRSFK